MTQRKAILTIDDGPTSITVELLRYLLARNIVPVLFVLGQNLEKHPEAADFAVQTGCTLANHSYSHPAFSSIPLDRCRDEILRGEALVQAVYDRNNKQRTLKHFRFPFGDKGGEKHAAVQAILEEVGYVGLPGLDIQYDWYFEHGLDRDRDVFWTFDCLEYKTSDGVSDFSMDDVKKRIIDPSPALGGSLSAGTSDEIILTHDHEHTHLKHPFYYRDIVGAIEKQNVFIRS